MNIEEQLGLTGDVIEAIEAINEDIATLTVYGVRVVGVTRRPSYLLSWSNAGSNWSMRPAQLSRGEFRIQPNQLIVGGVKKALLSKTLKWLDPLPLYEGSFAAKERGIFNPWSWYKAIRDRRE